MNDYVYSNIISGKTRVTKNVRREHFTMEQYEKLQEYYGSKKTLSPVECALWLDLSVNTIYELIHINKIIATKTKEAQGKYLINVRKTKRTLNID